MAHPYKSQANSSANIKASKVGSTTNLDKASARAAVPHKIETSSSTMQNAKQSCAPGMKRGGRLDKNKRGGKKPSKPIMAEEIAPALAPAAPSPVPGGMQAGAGPSPVPAPIMKKGGSVQKKAGGGAVSYPLKKGGSDSGVGRLEKSKGAM